MAYTGAKMQYRSLFFTVSPKVLGKVVVGSGQNKNLLWECDHWTKVRLRRDNFTTVGKICVYSRRRRTFVRWSYSHSRFLFCPDPTTLPSTFGDTVKKYIEIESELPDT